MSHSLRDKERTDEALSQMRRLRRVVEESSQDDASSNVASPILQSLGLSFYTMLKLCRDRSQNAPPTQKAVFVAEDGLFIRYTDSKC